MTSTPEWIYVDIFPEAKQHQHTVGFNQTSMGKDPDSKWVHWLALRRGNSPDSLLSSSPFPSSFSKTSSPSSNPMFPRSSATSYFSLLSADDSRSFANRKMHQGNAFGLATQDMDSLWVACFRKRWNQHHAADVPDKAMQAIHGLSSEGQELQPATVTTASQSVNTMGTTSFLSSLNALLDQSDIDIDTTLTFPDLQLPFDSTTQATKGLDDGIMTCFEDQNAFPPNILDDESGRSTPASKHSREGYPGEYANNNPTQPKNMTHKKQKTLHSGTSYAKLPSFPGELTPMCIFSGGDPPLRPCCLSPPYNT